MSAIAAGRVGAHAIGPRTIRKLQVRLLPYLFLLYVIAFIDRINLGFAAFTMNKELGIDARQFGLAAGIFFFGYFLFEIRAMRTWRRGFVLWAADNAFPPISRSAAPRELLCGLSLCSRSGGLPRNQRRY